ncbi:hypothetical protein [Streptomyces sp. NPDC021096]|uniref:hypothetical protein n=1 Tax=Streptomyces sp. NPDC021096 TaxID=3154792 RepID=UPI0033E6FCDB
MENLGPDPFDWGDEWEITDEPAETPHANLPEHFRGPEIVKFGSRELHVSFESREGSELNRSAVFLALLAPPIFGSMTIAGICKLAEASSTVTLALALPAFVLLEALGWIWVIMRKAP